MEADEPYKVRIVKYYHPPPPRETPLSLMLTFTLPFATHSLPAS
jgi:hypothetical protein